MTDPRVNHGGSGVGFVGDGYRVLPPITVVVADKNPVGRGIRGRVELVDSAIWQAVV